MSKKRSNEYVGKLYKIVASMDSLLKQYNESIDIAKNMLNSNFSIDAVGCFLNQKDKLPLKKATLEKVINSYERIIKDFATRENNWDYYSPEEMDSLIPKREAYAIDMSEDKLKKILIEIIIDYIELNKNDYNQRKFHAVDLAIIFRFPEQSISHHLLKKGIRTKRNLTDGDLEEIKKLYSQGITKDKIADQLNLSESTVYQHILKFKRNESERNRKNSVEDSHNEVITKLIKRVPISDDICIYSEHITRYNDRKILSVLDASEIQFNIDLVILNKNEPIVSVEVEISNDLEKSLRNLKNYYPKCKYKALFVTSKKLEKAIRIRNNISSDGEIHVFKISRGYDEDFKSDILKLLKI
jgi:predicted transcriptional regulator